jgi:hypothetical protein
VTETTITAQIHQPFDVDRHFSTEITFDGETPDFLSETLKVGIRQVLNLPIQGHPARHTKLLGSGPPNAVDRHQADLRMLVWRYINASNTGHDFPLNNFTYRQN